jgi:hypothetical protein
MTRDRDGQIVEPGHYPAIYGSNRCLLLYLIV